MARAQSLVAQLPVTGLKPGVNEILNSRSFEAKPAAQLNPSGHGPNEVEGRRRRLAGSSHLIEAFYAKATYERRVLVLAGVRVRFLR